MQWVNGVHTAGWWHAIRVRHAGAAGALSVSHQKMSILHKYVC